MERQRRSREFSDTQGGIFLWVKLPDGVDTTKLYEAALARVVAINPGPQWSAEFRWEATDKP